MKPIANVPDLIDGYIISEDGLVYSNIKKRYLKGQLNSCKYMMYYLQLTTGKTKCFMAHRLVALTYLPLPKEEGLEINHKDGNKLNNQVDNLEWVTHSENVLKSFREQNRKGWWLGKNKPSPSVETKLLMSNAKKKKVAVYRWKKYVNTYESIESLCADMGWYRKKFNRILNGTNKKLAKQFTFKFIDDIIDP
jgi:hypothetical protein